MNYDLLQSFGRMFPDFSLPAKVTTFLPSSLNWTASGILERGDVLMLNTSDWPSAAEGPSASSLDRILEPMVAPKYFLSPKACAGILRRAEKRGKKLPAHLEAALRAVAFHSDELLPQETSAAR